MKMTERQKKIRRFKSDLRNRLRDMHSLADNMCGGTFEDPRPARKELRKTKRLLLELIDLIPSFGFE